MLLRRIDQHVRDQNWFAVGIDFCIVVIGVFIGIQVANWNEARADRQAERLLLERLHDEISEAQAFDQAASELFVNDRLKNLVSARHVVFGVDERTELTVAECQAIGFSHLPLIGGGVGIPVLEELRATGEITLIRDEGIVRKVSRLTTLFENARGFEESIRSKITLLSREFPDLVSMGIEQQAVTLSDFEIDPYDAFYTCDAVGMRASAAFRGALGENASLQFSLLEAAVDPLRQALSELSDALDRALDMPKVEGAPS